MASRGVNKVIIIGRLGHDPEIRYSPSGTAFANLTVATSEQWRDKQTGEQKGADGVAPRGNERETGRNCQRISAKRL